jgi:hypothetical protein
MSASVRLSHAVASGHRERDDPLALSSGAKTLLFLAACIYGERALSPPPCLHLRRVRDRPSSVSRRAGASSAIRGPVLVLVGTTTRLLARLASMAAALLAGLLGSGPAPASASSPVAQSLLRSTSDVARAGALLDEFLAQLPQAGPQSAEELRARLVAFLDAQAGSAATAIERRVDAVLWLYGTLWLPLIMVLCALWASRGEQGRGGEEPLAARRASEGGGSARRRHSRSGRAAGAPGDAVY